MYLNEEDIRYFTQLRHKLHQIPELAYNERKSANLVCNELDKMGIDYEYGLGKTGIVAWVKKGSSNRAIALRADLDALPIEEKTALPYASKHKGVMHACGHDGHTTMLLAAAKYIKEKLEFDGVVYFIFQPAEEGGAGAKAMIEDGLFEKFKIDKIYGLHNRPTEPFGTFLIKEGGVMSAIDIYKIKVEGKSAHSSQPHNAINPILVASHIVLALKNISSQDINPANAHVVSVARIEGGTTFNIIPSECLIEGSIRVLDKETQEVIEKRVKEIAKGIAAAFDTKAEVEYEHKYPITINSDIDAALRAIKRTTTPDKIVTNFPSSMGSEDFSFFLEKVPGCYVWLGSKKEGKKSAPLHSAYYDFEDDLINLGATYWINLVDEELGVGKKEDK
ncbi:MAG: amidohydrolase [Epsilonproteobacteria bacterium]|nr:amidohydrolase [Campylobacterota bacterium]